MWKIKENSIILEISLSEIRKLNYYARNHHTLFCEEVEKEELRVRGEVQTDKKVQVWYVEMFEPSFHLLPYLDEYKIFSLINILKFKEIDDETKENLIKLSKNADFKNEILLNISYNYMFEFDNDDERDLQCDLLSNPRIELNLNELDHQFNRYYNYKYDIIPKLLEHRSLHFTEQEITDYYDRKEKIFKGLEFPSEQDLKMDWTYIWDNNEITIIGYKGSLNKVKIPKKLNDGTIISKIDNHVLSQDNDEFLYVNTKIENIYPKYHDIFHLDTEELEDSEEDVKNDYPPENSRQVQLSDNFLTRFDDYDHFDREYSMGEECSFVELLDYVAPVYEFSDILRLFYSD